MRAILLFGILSISSGCCGILSEAECEMKGWAFYNCRCYPPLQSAGRAVPPKKCGATM